MNTLKREPVLIVAIVCAAAIYCVHGWLTGDWGIEWAEGVIYGIVGIVGVLTARSQVTPVKSPDIGAIMDNLSDDTTNEEPYAPEDDPEFDDRLGPQ